MLLGVLKENKEAETRVALHPEGVASVEKLGLKVGVETGAGELSYSKDELYQNQGAEIYTDRKKLLNEADVIIHIHPPDEEIIRYLKEGCIWISFISPHESPETVRLFEKQGVTVFAMESLPRISRAQSMDALSSMASLGGYKSVLMAATSLGKYMPMMMTAAGTIPPSKVLVLGAGVAGLQAIATARRLGAVVEAFDVRAAVKEQVESLGATFVETETESDAETKGGYAREQDETTQTKQRELLAKHAAKSDIVITTALIPGKKAPVLITGEMVTNMKAGSIIMDLAAGQGGNCELSKPDQTVIKNGVTIFGPTNLPATMPIHASRLYGKNMIELLTHLMKDGEFTLDFEDEITRKTVLTHQGKPVE